MACSMLKKYCFLNTAKQTRKGNNLHLQLIKFCNPSVSDNRLNLFAGNKTIERIHVYLIGEVATSIEFEEGR